MNAVDTNILEYAASIDEPVRGPAALRVIEGFEPASTVLLWQVAVGFMGVMARLHRQGRTDSRGDSFMSSLRSRFTLITPAPGTFDLAVAIEAQLRLSWWDSLIIAACVSAGVDLLYSEDLPGRVGQVVSGVRVVNPLPLADPGS